MNIFWGDSSSWTLHSFSPVGLFVFFLKQEKHGWWNLDIYFDINQKEKHQTKPPGCGISDGLGLSLFFFGDVNNKKRNLHAWNVHEVSLYLNKISYPTAPVIPCEVRCLGTQKPTPKVQLQKGLEQRAEGMIYPSKIWGNLTVNFRGDAKNHWQNSSWWGRRGDATSCCC